MAAAPKEHLKALGESVVELLEAHLQLFKLELKEDARRIAVQVAAVVGLVPLILVAWWFLCAALAVMLSRLISMESALVLMALFNVAVAALGIGIAVFQLKRRRYLGQTTSEAKLSAALVTDSVKGVVAEVKHPVQQEVLHA